MKRDVISFLWEAAKSVIPAILAWWLSTRTARKKADANKKELREQLKIQKDNSLEVQNKAYKLQFGLDRLSEYEMLSEKMLQQFVLIKRYFNENYFINNDFVDLITAKRDTNDFLETTQEFFHYYGLVEVAVHAVNPDADEMCDERLRAFESAVEAMSPTFRSIVHDTDVFLNRDAQDKNSIKGYALKVKHNVKESDEGMTNLLNELENLRNFIIEMIEITYRKLG